MTANGGRKFVYHTYENQHTNRLWRPKKNNAANLKDNLYIMNERKKNIWTPNTSNDHDDDDEEKLDSTGHSHTEKKTHTHIYRYHHLHHRHHHIQDTPNVNKKLSTIHQISTTINQPASQPTTTTKE